jgi:septal ring factor EnvC (AmiA/AmiB activator)
MKSPEQHLSGLERLSLNLTNWIGTPSSILVHTIFFAGAFSLRLFGVSLDQVLLILTTAVSLEAIYLAILIQMTVNRNTQSLAEVEEDIGEIEEDIGEIHEEMEELGDDVEEIAEDIEEIQEEDEAEEKEEESTKITLEKIEVDLQRLLTDIELLKKQK